MRPEATLHCNFVSPRIRVVEIEVPVEISIPANAHGLVVFGDGVNRDSKSEVQNRIADILNENGYGSVVGQLILPEDSTSDPHSGELCCGLDLLEQRLLAVTDWIAMQPGLQDLPLAYFGAGIGAEACLIAAARRPEIVRAVVACGPKLRHVNSFLHNVISPVLLVYGDDETLPVQRQQVFGSRLPESTLRELVLVGHAFDPINEEDATENIAVIARAWFDRFMLHRKTTSAR